MGVGLTLGGKVRGTVEVNRERQRLRRLRKLAVVLTVVSVWMWWRIANGKTPWPILPKFSDEALFWLPGIIIIAMLAVVLIVPMLGNSRSPHVLFRAEQLDIGFSDVKGLGRVLDEVGHTLRVLLDHEILRNTMGGSPRRGVLFEGPPGTGKTHVAKAMAQEKIPTDIVLQPARFIRRISSSHTSGVSAH